MAKKLYFILFNLIGLLIYYKPLKVLVRLSFHNQLYSHFLLVPLVSLFFMATERRRIFEDIGYSPFIGLSVVVSGLLLYAIGIFKVEDINQNDFLFFCMLGAVTWFIGDFITFYGMQAFKKALFPLMFLVAMVPMPLVVLEPVIRFLQVSSAHAAGAILRILGIPYFRHGMVFEFTDVTIEVAKECSGIRSSLALTLTAIIAGHMFLKSGWKKFVLVLSVFPVAIFKNAIRITTITLLALYVDKQFLTDSWLHRSGGIVFFLFALMLLAPLLWGLKKTENNGAANRRAK